MLAFPSLSGDVACVCVCLMYCILCLVNRMLADHLFIAFVSFFLFFCFLFLSNFCCAFIGNAVLHILLVAWMFCCAEQALFLLLVINIQYDTYLLCCDRRLEEYIRNRPAMKRPLLCLIFFFITLLLLIGSVRMYVLSAYCYAQEL